MEKNPQNFAMKISCYIVTVTTLCCVVLHQLQIHNLDWEVAFGHSIGWTPQQSLCLLLEPNKIPSNIRTLTPHEWTPETVMADFVKYGFLEMMDDINRSMDV